MCALGQFLWPRLFVSLSYKTQRDDDEISMEEVNSQNDKMAQNFEPKVLPVNPSRFQFINYWNAQNAKWKENLQRQQRNIYQDHTMLN